MMVYCRSEGTHSDAGVIQYLHHGYELMQDGRLYLHLFQGRQVNSTTSIKSG
jgi:hypothetical protein